MGDYYDNAKSAQREKAQRRVAGKKGDIDASGWKEPTMEAEKKTGFRPPKDAYKRGGEVKASGKEAKKHAGRRPRRADGGSSDPRASTPEKQKIIRSLMTNDATSSKPIGRSMEEGEYGTDDSVDVGYRKNGGKVSRKKRDEGGSVMDMLFKNKKSSRDDDENDDDDDDEEDDDHVRGCRCEECSGGRAEKLDREERASGGKVKRKQAKTNININLNSKPPGADLAAMLPPGGLPPPMPPAGGPPPMVPPPDAGGPPPGGPPPMAPGAGPMPRASGGRAQYKMNAGAGGGEGRLEKARLQKRLDD